jgi:hypothetical protein
METDKLVVYLASDTPTVRRVAAPWLKTALWVKISLPYVAGAVMVTKPTLADFLGAMDPRFIVERAAILATALAASRSTGQ